MRPVTHMLPAIVSCASLNLRLPVHAALERSLVTCVVDHDFKVSAAALHDSMSLMQGGVFKARRLHVHSVRAVKFFAEPPSEHATQCCSNDFSGAPTKKSSSTTSLKKWCYILSYFSSFNDENRRLLTRLLSPS